MSEEAAFHPIGDFSAAGAARGAGVLAADSAGRVLLHLRDDRPGLLWGGYWSVFGGGVEPGEGLAEAARREMEEEIGVCLSPDDLVPSSVVVSTSAQRTRLFLFACRRAVEPGEIRLGEGAGFAFYTERQLSGLHFVPYIRPALQFFLASRRKSGAPA